MKFYAGIFNLSNMGTEKNIFAAILSTPLGYFLTLTYGGEWNLLCMTALVAATAYDWVSGIQASKKDDTYASVYGLQGMIRTLVVLSLPAFASTLDRIFTLPNIFFFLFWGGIMVHTLTSFTANSVRAGWDRWIPNWAIEAVASEINAKINRSKERLPSPGANPEEEENKRAK
ncbi:phage holin family protein [Rossellomorea sp. BNER]|uniref:phage holin family protein n=1 Tax=Rossellomorea sp. BNER TaxID=2962031 RepID=UPI003AF20431|nr:phage holin family protein [Rossellomorea sp. BNER]